MNFFVFFTVVLNLEWRVKKYKVWCQLSLFTYKAIKMYCAQMSGA